MDRDYDLTWSDDDLQYVASCKQFPFMTWLADTPGEALAELHELLRELTGEEIDDQY